MSMKVDMGKQQIYDRIVELKIGGKDVDPDAYYTICSTGTLNRCLKRVTEFIRKGGDGYVSLSRGEIVSSPFNGTTLHSVVESYMKKHQKLSPTLENRIVIL